MDSERNRIERDDLLSLKRSIEPELARLDELILAYKPQDNDQDFNDLINKAAYYRDILIRINLDLAELDR